MYWAHIDKLQGNFSIGGAFDKDCMGPMLENAN